MLKLAGRIVMMAFLTVIALVIGSPYSKDAKRRRRAGHRPSEVLDGPYHLRS